MIIFKTPLYVAVEKENVEIVRLLLTKEDIDVNIQYIFNFLFFQNSDLNHLMKF